MLFEILKKDVKAAMSQARTTKSKIALVFTVVVIAAVVSGSMWFWVGVLVYGVTVFHRIRVAEAKVSADAKAKPAKQN
jgi:hypothetical protein